MKTFRFSLVLRIRENTDLFIILDKNIDGKSKYPLYFVKKGLFSAMAKKYIFYIGVLT